MKIKTRFTALLLSAALLLELTACGTAPASQSSENATSGASSNTSSASSNAENDGESVVITNMDRTTEYEKAPQRAIALSYHIAEIMVALGLEDHIIAVAPSMSSLSQVQEKYRDTIGSFPLLEETTACLRWKPFWRKIPTLSTAIPTRSMLPA